MKTKLLLTTALASLLAFSGSAFGYQAKDTSKAATTTKGPSKTTTPPPNDADIANAKARGDVWVNLSSKVYHKSDNQWYGKTKSGKFMPEADAIKAGYTAAKESPIGKKKSSGTTKK